ncbi:acyltransferase [Mesorhizobium sp. BE184]|uniref:acyltransferase family protein n=1 Tax=Mesorhizobium sp. BE184 TaxID=2817714 RepID=UPI0028646AA1|nr:acyltransferase [Mesorhizobium sp. BE184]MDR7031659.1 peptidoglycan/LPS O-acetylase OafA/YrhL [Mesorhizobium sp. BE184]
MISPDRRRGIPELDAVRGIAAATVALWHWISMANLPYPSFKSAHAALSTGSELAVTIFFVLSGMVLTLSIRNAKGGGDGIIILSYFVRRIFRIFPLLIVVVSFAFVEMYALRAILGIETQWKNYANFTFSIWIDNILLFLTTFNPPGWTLKIEIVGYILIPFIVLAGSRPLLKALIYGCLFIILSILIVKTGWWIIWPSYKQLMPMFIPGIFLGFIANTPDFKNTSALPFLVAGIVGLGILIRVQIFQYDLTFLVSTCCACLVVWAILDRGPFHRFINSPALRWLGDISYGTFLWHYPLLWCWFYIFGSYVGTTNLWIWLAAGAVGLPLTLLFSQFTFRYVERPMMEFASRLTRQFKGKDAPRTDASAVVESASVP